MGIGEPLDNFENTLKFLELVNSADGLNIGYRHISVSTCGLVDKIAKLAEKNLPVTLSVSLHAPNDALRSSLMRINDKWSVGELLEACRKYADLTGRRISFEYILLAGINDSPENARELAFALKSRRILCHVNLITASRTERPGFLPPDRKTTLNFQKILEAGGVNATIRRKCGEDINAACGQLRKKIIQSGEHQ
jgi:23S rRNA (adenine2503-C2)-methyltransferase